MHEPRNASELTPPVLAVANQAFCSLLRYRLVRTPPILFLMRPSSLQTAHVHRTTQDELLGCGINDIVRVDMETFFAILPSVFPQRKPYAVGDPFRASFTWITKDKHAVHTRTRNQYFFSKRGYVRHKDLPWHLCFFLALTELR